MSLNEVVEEIRGKHGLAPAAPEKTDKSEKPENKGKKERVLKTKAEIEAYRQKMMAKEEAKYLKMSPNTVNAPKTSEPVKVAVKRPRKSRQARVPEDSQKQTIQTRHPKQPKQPRQPKMLQPMEVLYLLKVPGLPKGDCVAICLVHGAEQ